MHIAVHRSSLSMCFFCKLMMAMVLLSACGAPAETVVPEETEAPATATTESPEFHTDSLPAGNTPENGVLAPAEFPNCQMWEDVESLPAEGQGYSTAREALIEFPVTDFPYEIFEITKKTNRTVIWEMRDANNTRAGEVTARKSTWGWVVSHGAWCVPSRTTKKLNLE